VPRATGTHVLRSVERRRHLPSTYEFDNSFGEHHETHFLSALAAVSLFALAACGSSTSDRALSGAGIGAGAARLAVCCWAIR